MTLLSSGKDRVDELQGALAATRHGSSVNEKRTFSVSLVSKDPTGAIDEFFKYRGHALPLEGEIISVVRFIRGRAIRARVTRVDPRSIPPIEATPID
jgi:hypothetical protein